MSTSTIKALAFSFLDRYASLFINIILSMIIARLLTPEEIGIFSVVMVMLAFVATVRDLGTGQYLVQEKELTTERIRAVWAVQLGLGLLLAVILLVVSGPVARFYDEPRIRNIIFVLALNYAINPFGSLTYAWLMREMQFDSIALIRFSATLTGACVSTLLAWNGYGPMSLALGSVATTVISSGMSIFFRPKHFPWLPGLHQVRRVLSFGTKLTATSIANTLSSGAPELALGKLQNMTITGFYSRSNGLVMMFNRLVTDAVFSVALSWFSKQSREKGNFVESFLKATSYISALGWSFCLAIIFLAQPIIRVLYGDQWDSSVDLTRLLAAGMAFSAPVALCASALLASGAVDKVFQATAMSTILTIALAVVGAAFGLIPLGWAMIIAAAANALIWIRIVQKEISFLWFDLWQVLIRSGLVAFVSAIPPVIVFAVFGPYPEQYFFSLAIGGFGSVFGFLVAVVALRHPIQDELIKAWLLIFRKK